MDSGTNNNRRRNTMFFLIGAGGFLLLNWLVNSVVTMIGFLLIFLGLYHIRTNTGRKGYIMIGVGGLTMLGHDFILVISLILLGIGYYFLQQKNNPEIDNFVHKKTLINSSKSGKEPWVVKNMNYWAFINEFHVDFTMAILEEKETTIILQGFVCDVGVIIPEYIGLEVDNSLWVGQLSINQRIESGFMMKNTWKSPNYETSEQKVKLIISYPVGNVDVKVM